MVNKQLLQKMDYTSEQKEIIDNMNEKELKEHISLWLGNGHRALAGYAQKRLDKVSYEHDVVIPIEACDYD